MAAHALADVEWDACVLEPLRRPELEAEVRRRFGTLPTSVPYLASVPWVVRSMTDTSLFGAPPLSIPTELAELIGLVVSQDNSCRYCFGITRMMMRVYGMSEKQIGKLEQNFLDAEIDPRSKAALDFSRRLSRAAPRVQSSDVLALVAAGFTREEILEIAFFAVQSVYMNRLMTVSAIPFGPAERLGNSRMIRWVAPLMRRRMNQLIRRARERSGALEAPAAPVPWGFVARAFRGTTAARKLHETLAGAFESSVLGARAKGLIFAVVARGLDCSRSEREAGELLHANGFDDGRIETVLTHLGSPDLDELEAELVPFARGTIRGRPVQLQQRTGALVARFGSERTVEAIAIAALANAVCRLGAVTELE
ncbi:MAG TPA: hypothetical protein VMR31_16540 [Myxococcota bacterium]|nr:hypothetical protein [Myxococcota bacterium]